MVEYALAAKGSQRSGSEMIASNIPLERHIGLSLQRPSATAFWKLLSALIGIPMRCAAKVSCGITLTLMRCSWIVLAHGIAFISWISLSILLVFLSGHSYLCAFEVWTVAPSTSSVRHICICGKILRMLFLALVLVPHAWHFFMFNTWPTKRSHSIVISKARCRICILVARAHI